MPFLPSAFLAASAQGSGDLPGFIASFADTLLPAGAFASGAAVGAQGRLADRAATDPGFADILRRAAAAIDDRCRQMNGRSFRASPPAVRDKLFHELSQIPDTELLGWFFQAARAEVFFHYYGQPGMGATVGLGEAPQPEGFEDIQDPWRAA